MSDPVVATHRETRFTLATVGVVANHNDQNLTFKPSCSDRGEFAVPVTVPNVAGLLTFAAGFPMMTVFRVLKDSARNSRL